MKASRFTAKQIVAILREADRRRPGARALSPTRDHRDHRTMPTPNAWPTPDWRRLAPAVACCDPLSSSRDL